MSVYYQIKEHLHVSNISTDEYGPKNEVVEIMRGSMAALGALYLLDDARVFDIRMEADGQSYTVSKESKEKDFKKILDVMGAAADINLTVEYEYRSTTGWNMYDLVGPFPLMSYMDGTEVSELNDIFYTAWNSADCSDGPGILVAYGEHAGKAYHGNVEYASVSEIPAGKWENSDTVIFLEPDHFDESAHPEVIPLCKKLQAIGLDSTLSVGDGELDFSLDNIILDSAEKGIQFLEIVSKLQELMPDDFSMMANFYDLSSEDVRLMVIDEVESGFKVKVAQV